MKEFKNMKVQELSKTAKINVTGGWSIGSLAFAVLFFSVVSVLEYPEAFEKGVNETFESAL